MTRVFELLGRIRWRLFAGKHAYATDITRFLRQHPGASTRQIVNYLFRAFPSEARDQCSEFVECELEPLNRFGVVEYRDGWHLTARKNPFSELSETLNGFALVDALSILSTTYAGTCESRLAREMALFIADERNAESDREHLYLCFLDLLGVSWSADTTAFASPADYDWIKLNRFLPSELRR